MCGLCWRYLQGNELLRKINKFSDKVDKMNTKDINSQLKKRREHYPPDERAGFNFMRDFMKMLQALHVNEVEFLSGMLTVITVQLRRTKKEEATNTDA